MNVWNWSSVELHATPTNSACPAHFCAASSTEEASRLQVLHQGAQNHSSTGRPASVVSSMSPPPTSGAANLSASGTLAGTLEVGSPGLAGVLDGAAAGCVAGVLLSDGDAAAAGDAGSVSAPPQAASMPTAMRGRTRRFTIGDRTGRPSRMSVGCRRVSESFRFGAVSLTAR